MIALDYNSIAFLSKKCVHLLIYQWTKAYLQQTTSLVQRILGNVLECPFIWELDRRVSVLLIRLSSSSSSLQGAMHVIGQTILLWKLIRSLFLISLRRHPEGLFCLSSNRSRRRSVLVTEHSHWGLCKEELQRCLFATGFVTSHLTQLVNRH